MKEKEILVKQKKTTKKKKAKKNIPPKISHGSNYVFGRPPKYNSPEDMQRIVDLYFLACKVHKTGDIEMLTGLSMEELLIINDIDDVTPSISGLAYLLGMTTQALRNYECKENFLCTVKKAKQRVECSLEQRLAGHSVTGAIFSLKNNFEWKDKSEQDITTGGEPIKNEWHVHPVVTVKK